MKARWIVVAAVCAGVAALSAVPAAASACPSLAGVKAYQGHAAVGFHAQNSGPDVGNGGTYAAQLERNLSSVEIKLKHKKVVRNHVTGSHAIFTGKAVGGNVTVDDNFNDTGAMFSGQESYNGPLGQLPNFGSAFLLLDLNSCHYKLSVSFGVQTTFTGTLDSGSHPSVSGTVYSEREHIPGNLHLVGGAGPNAYGRACPGGDPFLATDSCYEYGGGTIGLCSTFDVSTSNCPADPVGTAQFTWVLKPKKK